MALPSVKRHWRIVQYAFTCLLLAYLYLNSERPSAELLIDTDDALNQVFNDRIHARALQPRTTPHHYRHLQKRGAYENNAARGCPLVQLMSTPDSDLETKYKAKWSNYNDITKYGWTSTTGDINLDERTSAASVLASLGLTSGLDDPNWTKISWSHDKPFQQNGKTIQPTKAHYMNLYNPVAGIIIAANNKSPIAMVNDGDAEGPVPDIYRWSDINFLTYKSLADAASHPVNNLKHIIQLNVIGGDMEETLEHITGGGLDGTLVAFPGEKVGDVPNGEEARALIGSSNGLGIAWLLIQHKGELGDTRSVKEVRYWDSADGDKSGFAMLDGISNVLFSF